MGGAKPEWVSQRGATAHLAAWQEGRYKVDKRTITNWIVAGKIKARADKKVNLREVEAYSVASESDRRPSAPPTRSPVPASPPDLDRPAPTSSAELERWARARKIDAERRIKEADAAEREGSLVPIAEVRADATAIVAELRSKLQVLGSRLAGLVAGRTVPEAQAVIDDAVNEVLAVLHEVRYADTAPAVADLEPCPVCGRAGE